VLIKALNASRCRLRVGVSVFVFWQIRAQAAEFSRALDEATLSPRAFLVGHRLVAEAVNFPICHLAALRLLPLRS
jgi:hypothetical protein